MKNLYIIAGCNGAGKTTASYTILPEILHCNEFINADEIAKGLSPFRPENASIQAGRLMLARIKQLLHSGEDFAFETTLSTKSYRNLILDAKSKGYMVKILFFYLNSPDLAVKRVEIRVKEGGHHIPEDIIRRRYENGLKNFYTIFCPIVNQWMFIENSGSPYTLIAQKTPKGELIYNNQIWDALKNEYYGK